MSLTSQNHLGAGMNLLLFSYVLLFKLLLTLSTSSHVDTSGTAALVLLVLSLSEQRECSSVWFLFSSSGTSCWTTLSGMVGSAPVGLYGDVASRFSASCLIALENLSVPWSLQALQSQGGEWISSSAPVSADNQKWQTSLDPPQNRGLVQIFTPALICTGPSLSWCSKHGKPAKAPLITSSRLWMPSGPF